MKREKVIAVEFYNERGKERVSLYIPTMGERGLVRTVSVITNGQACLDNSEAAWAATYKITPEMFEKAFLMLRAGGFLEEVREVK